MKNISLLLPFALSALCFSACRDNEERILSEDAQVYHFELQSESIPGLGLARFTIDQSKGEIYNPDSLAYGTVLNEKAVCTFTTHDAARVQVKQTALSDQFTPWNGIDPLDFSEPVEFVVTSEDGKNRKSYTAWINIHTADPERIAWRQLASGIYPEVEQFPSESRTVLMSPDSTQYLMLVTNNADAGFYTLSSASVEDAGTWQIEADNIAIQDNNEITAFVDLDLAVWFGDTLVVAEESENRFTEGRLFKSVDGGRNWEKVNTPGNLKMGRITGVLNIAGEGTYLCATAIRDDKYRFCRSSDLVNWESSDADIPLDFPIGGEYARSTGDRYRDILLVGGMTLHMELLNTVWSTSDGLNWKTLSSASPPFDKGRMGAMLTRYDGKLYLLGGTDANGQTTRNIMCSADGGLTWEPAGESQVFPTEYTARSFASVLVDKEQNLLLFGGRESASSEWLNEVWIGRISRLGWEL